MSIRSSAPAAALCVAAFLGPACAAHAAPPPPASLIGPTDLGSAYVHTAGADVVYQVINTSGAPVGKPNASLANGAGLWASFDGVPSCPFDANGDIQPGGSCTLKVHALPFGVGLHTGDILQVNFSHSSAGDPGFTTNALSLSSTGIAFTLSASAFDFGNQPLGALSPPQTFTVTRGGGVTISSADVNADDFLKSSDQCSGTTGPASAVSTCDVHVRFAPSALAGISAGLTVTSGDGSTGVVALSGTGVPAGSGPAGPQGPTGANGATGPAGPAGPQGPAGPAGKVVCRNTLAARLLCDQLFQPGTWTVAGLSGGASISLSRAGVVYARGRAKLRDGRVVSARLRPLRHVGPGRYQMTLRVRRHGTVVRVARGVRLR